MTELEAQEVVKRLERIWRPESLRWRLAPAPVRRANPPDFLYLHATLPNSLQLMVEGQSAPLIFCLVDEGRDYGLYLNQQGQFDQSMFGYEESTEDAQRQARFVAKWMDFFRHGLWLSGCDIEASAHEKAEWMQDFTAKETESCNLKV